MNDSISRKAAIKAFKDFLTIHDSRGVEYLCSAVTMDGVNKILSDLPSVQLQRMSDDETCDSCRYRDNELDEDPCNRCTPRDSRYCPDSKREWYQKGYEAGQKSVQPQRWIPVSETSPPSGEPVNVSCHDDSGDTAFDYTSCGWITTNGEYWIVDNEINSFVVAWMPLPKPYKEEQDESRMD